MAKSQNNKKSLTLISSSLFGIGYFPFAPGTAASLAGLIAFILIDKTSIFIIFTLISLIISLATCGRCEKLLKSKDPKEVVIDDFTGQLIALLFIPKEPAYIFISFLLFRIFDTIKIPPADIFDSKKGSIGIVGDDIVAGVYTNLLVQLVRLALNISS
jgi:phosphatidylglycerophosphatase A